MTEKQMNKALESMSPEVIRAQTDSILVVQKQIEADVMKAMSLPEDILNPQESTLSVADVKRAMDIMKQPAATPRYLTVVCVDNVGLEEQFDQDEEYVSEREHEDPDFVNVYDRHGRKRECFKDRFKPENDMLKWLKKRPNKNPIQVIIPNNLNLFSEKTQKNSSIV